MLLVFQGSESLAQLVQGADAWHCLGGLKRRGSISGVGRWSLRWSRSQRPPLTSMNKLISFVRYCREFRAGRTLGVSWLGSKDGITVSILNTTYRTRGDVTCWTFWYTEENIVFLMAQLNCNERFICKLESNSSANILHSKTCLSSATPNQTCSNLETLLSVLDYICEQKNMCSSADFIWTPLFKLCCHCSQSAFGTVTGKKGSSLLWPLAKWWKHLFINAESERSVLINSGGICFFLQM